MDASQFDCGICYSLILDPVVGEWLAQCARITCNCSAHSSGSLASMHAERACMRFYALYDFVKLKTTLCRAVELPGATHTARGSANPQLGSATTNTMFTPSRLRYCWQMQVHADMIFANTVLRSGEGSSRRLGGLSLAQTAAQNGHAEAGTRL